MVLVFTSPSLAVISARKHAGWHRRLHYFGMAMMLSLGLGGLRPLPLMIPYAHYVVFALILLFPLAGR